MKEMYGQEHRELQDQFETRKLADRLEEIIVKTEFDENDKAFIESQNMFFLSTINHEGHPTVSYKGGFALISFNLRWFAVGDKSLFPTAANTSFAAGRLLQISSRSQPAANAVCARAA